MPTIISVARRASRFIKFGLRSRKAAFEDIFASRYWGDKESISGVGSSLAQTENIRRELPKLVKEFGIKTILDAPCGDLYWMSLILDEMGVDYIGGDIVPDVVNIARERSQYNRSRFIELDIVKDELPPADLWVCRDVLFHLSFKNIRDTFANFARSEVKYILVTSHIGDHIANRNIASGDFRQLNLLRRPIGLPEDKVLYRFDDYAPPAPPREMLLFHRDDLKQSFGS